MPFELKKNMYIGMKYFKYYALAESLKTHVNCKASQNKQTFGIQLRSNNIATMIHYISYLNKFCIDVKKCNINAIQMLTFKN